MERTDSTTKARGSLSFCYRRKVISCPRDCKGDSKVSWLAEAQSTGPSKSLATVSFEENGDGSDHQVGAAGLKFHAIDVAVIQGAAHGRGPRHCLYRGVLSDLFLSSFQKNLDVVRPKGAEGQPLEVKQLLAFYGYIPAVGI